MTEAVGRAIREGDALQARFEVTEARVAGFAMASGDEAAHHMDDEFARNSSLGGRVVHGVLILGFVSAASTALLTNVSGHYVSTGYEHVRFRLPVILGQHLWVDVSYEVVELTHSGRFVRAEFEAVREDGLACCTGQHLMARLDDPPPATTP